MLRLLAFPIVFAVMSCGSNEQPKESVDPSQDSVNKAPVTKESVNEVQGPAPFNKEVSFESIVFKVPSPGTDTANSFTVTPSGLTVSNDAFTFNINGQVMDIEAGDIDADASPELLVKTMDPGTKKGTAYVYSANKRKSLSMVNYPDESGNQQLMAGYQGEDDFALIEGRFMRRFPLFEGGQKTGKIRQLQYQLKPGEAMKQLVLEKSYEF